MPLSPSTVINKMKSFFFPSRACLIEKEAAWPIDGLTANGEQEQDRLTWSSHGDG